MERKKQKHKDREKQRETAIEGERQSQRGGRESYTPHWHVGDPQEQNVPHKVERERKNLQYSGQWTIPEQMERARQVLPEQLAVGTLRQVGRPLLLPN